MNKKMILLLASIIVLIGGFIYFMTSGEGSKPSRISSGRWYTQSQVTGGKKLFQLNCAVCHGENAQSIKNWKQAFSDGSYPPPPLDGTAHAWHHSMDVLKQTVRNGGMSMGGMMPPFKDKLSEEEIEQVIAYFQSFWNPKIYYAWLQRSSLK